MLITLIRISTPLRYLLPFTDFAQFFFNFNVWDRSRGYAKQKYYFSTKRNKKDDPNVKQKIRILFLVLISNLKTLFLLYLIFLHKWFIKSQRPRGWGKRNSHQNFNIKFWTIVHNCSTNTYFVCGSVVFEFWNLSYG